MEIKSDGYKIAVVGATGMVGRKLLDILEERRFPAADVRLLASSRSTGKKVHFGGREIGVAKLEEGSLREMDLVFFCAGGDVSAEFAPIAARAGAVVIDKSALFRMDPDVPLVVPEVNGDDLETIPRNIVSSPNCSTIPLVMVLKPLLEHGRLTRVVVSTYQAASGAGAKGVFEMMDQVKAEILSLPAPEPKTFPRKIAFNLFPQIDSFVGEGYTKEEMKLINESRKILHTKDLPITCTAVRVPVANSHSESVTVDFEEPVSPSLVREILSEAPGVVVMDDPSRGVYPVPEDASGRDEVLVGRIRRDTSREGSINLWIVSDNIRKGAATNAVQIAEKICHLKGSVHDNMAKREGCR